MKHQGAVLDYWQEVAKRMKEREATRYIGTCPGCGEQRPDLFLIDDPILCGDCGLAQMVKDMGGVRIK